MKCNNCNSEINKNMAGSEHVIQLNDVESEINVCFNGVDLIAKIFDDGMNLVIQIDDDMLIITTDDLEFLNEI